MFDLQSIAIPFIVFLLFLLTVLFITLAVRRMRSLLAPKQERASPNPDQPALSDPVDEESPTG